MTTPPYLLRVATTPWGSLREMRAPRTLALLNERRTADRAFEERRDQLVLQVTEQLNEVSSDDPRRFKLLKIRRAIHNSRSIPAKLLADASVPQNPLSQEFLAYNSRKDQQQQQQLDLEQEYLKERDHARQGLMTWAESPSIREGLRLASRELAQRSQGLPRVVASGWKKKQRHVGAKLAGYFSRSVAKTSPNSTFCSVGLGQFSATPFVHGENVVARSELLLNVAQARKISDCLMPPCPPRTNPTLHRSTETSWSYWRWSSARDDSDFHALAQVESHPVLEKFLKDCIDGDLDQESLVSRIAESTGLSETDLEAFLSRLIDAGLLVNRAETPYNDRRPLRTVVDLWSRETEKPTWWRPARDLEQELQSSGSQSSEARLANYARWEDQLGFLPHVRPLDHNELFRLDTATALRTGLPNGVLEEVQKTVSRYARLFATLYPPALYQRRYHQWFRETFDVDQDIPLLEVYRHPPSPNGGEAPAVFPDVASEDSLGDSETKWTKIQDVLARWARQHQGQEEAAAPWQELLGCVDRDQSPRWCSSVLFQVAAKNATELAKQQYRVVVNALFPGAGIAMARFHELLSGERNDSRLTEELLRGWTPYQRDGATLAEVTYMHGGRTANAGLRPALFDHEIELPGQTASKNATALPLSDLSVRLDTTSSRFRLHSMRLGSEIRPVICSGINPEGFVSFLIHVGQQDFQPLAWFPGFDVPGIASWPRMVDGRSVLFRRWWSFGQEEYPFPSQTALSELDWFARVAEWRQRWSLPGRVFVRSPQKAKPFFIDLESPVLVDLLRRELRRTASPPQRLYVAEVYPDIPDCWVQDSRGRYAAEFLVQLHEEPAVHFQAQACEAGASS